MRDFSRILGVARRTKRAVERLVGWLSVGQGENNNAGDHGVLPGRAGLLYAFLGLRVARMRRGEKIGFGDGHAPS